MKFSLPLTLLAFSGFEYASASAEALANGWPIVFQAANTKGIGKFRNTEINANGKKFWLGKQTKNFCSSSNAANCPDVVRTVFAPLRSDGELFLGSYLPNANPADGQQVYLNEYREMSFLADGEELPDGAIKTFDTSVGSLKAVNGSTQLNSFFCPYTGGAYAITFAEGAVLRNCFPVTLNPVYAYGAYAYE